MLQDPQSGHDFNRRFMVFLLLLFGLFYVQMRFFAKPELEDPENQAREEEPVDDDPADPGEGEDAPEESIESPGDGTTGEGVEDIEEGTDDPPAQVEPPSTPPTWTTIGSLDPDSPYRMLVTLSSRGGALMRVELNEKSYRDVEDRTGYMGQIVADETVRGGGCPVQVIGPGTPAALAGFQPGDMITKFGDDAVDGFAGLRDALLKTDPGQTVKVVYLRDDVEAETEVTLAVRPLEVIRPEHHVRTYPDIVAGYGLHGFDPETNDQLSFLTTIQHFDGGELDDPATVQAGEVSAKQDQGRDETLDIELPELEGLSLRNDNWELVSSSEQEAVFEYRMPHMGLLVRKVYRLAEDGDTAEAEGSALGGALGYHLDFKIEIENIDPEESHAVAYSMDGPNGLPTEGAWYARKTGPGFKAYGMRDVLVSYGPATPSWVPCSHIATRNEKAVVWRGEPMRFIGVDGQYFSAIMIPKKQDPTEVWLDSATPIRVGHYTAKWRNITNVSFRMTSELEHLAPSESISHEYRVFLGPKKPDVLDEYELKETIYYGWITTESVAKPLQWILHMLVSVVKSYGIAIILLTVMVRLAMHPISRKQMAHAKKMQELQPEIKRITEQYKNEPEKRARAQQELFRKHNFNPLGGCGVMFLQLPIFIGLYRALQIDVELRQASLFGSGIAWCSNLAAPDQLINWSGFWEGRGLTAFSTGQGMLSLGPYFNILPLVTIGLFLAQQMIMMPKPTDDQQKAQRRMMNFMMLFMGLLFFKVASGLCIYFIASSIWGLVERRFLPKAAPVTGVEVETVPAKPVSTQVAERAEARKERRAKAAGKKTGKKR